MTSTLIDTNIILDILGPKGALRQWSIKALARCANEATLHVNEIIVSELAPAIPYERLNPVLGTMLVARSEIGFEASHRAGLAHLAYWKAGGSRDRTLPDFLIGAHASVAGHSLLTRDPTRYRTYFPDIDIIAPDTHP